MNAYSHDFTVQQCTRTARLRELADKIEKLPPESYNQNVFKGTRPVNRRPGLFGKIFPRWKEVPCACAGGHAGVTSMYAPDLMRDFGLQSSDQADALFGGTISFNTYAGRDHHEEVTPQVWAAQARRIANKIDGIA